MTERGNETQLRINPGETREQRYQRRVEELGSHIEQIAKEDELSTLEVMGLLAFLQASVSASIIDE